MAWPFIVSAGYPSRKRLSAALITGIVDAGIFLLFFRQIKQAGYLPGNPGYDFQNCRKTIARLPCVCSLYRMKKLVHFYLCCLWQAVGVVFAGSGLCGAHNGSARAIKNQPDDSFDGPGDQPIDQHGEHG